MSDHTHQTARHRSAPNRVVHVDIFDEVARIDPPVRNLLPSKLMYTEMVSKRGYSLEKFTEMMINGYAARPQ